MDGVLGSARVWVLLLLGVALSRPATAAVTFVVEAPAGTPAGSTLWISGDQPGLGNWNGAGLKLTLRADGRHEGRLELTAGSVFEYKIMRGSWDTVEKAADGGERSNRRATASGGADTAAVVVEKWRDQTEARPVRTPSRTGDIRDHVAFPSQHVLARDVWVWLPPGYEKSPRKRYPVVYFHDGQNVFDGATSFLPGLEWRADETADRLIREGRIAPCILVAIANSPQRREDYTLETDPRHGGGQSARYARFLVEELVPFVDRTYRTVRSADARTVIGSSLGGLVSLDLGLLHSDGFGRVGSLSPAVWWAGRSIVERVGAVGKKPLRIWVDIGSTESTPTADGHREWLEGAEALNSALLKAGWQAGKDLHYEVIEGAAHNESAWAARLDRVLEFLQAK